MSYRYSAFGLTLISDAPIGGLLPASIEAEPDLKVSFKTLPCDLKSSATSQTVWYVSPFTDDRGHPLLTVSILPRTGAYQFSYSDGAEYTIDASGKEIWAFSSGEATSEDLQSYLLGPIIGFVLRLCGFAALHASAVSLHGRAVLFAGAEFAGKSTTAMAFARQGYAVLSDNIVPLIERKGSILAQPAYPVMRLRSHSISALANVKTQFPLIPLPPFRKRVHLDLRQDRYRFQSEPLALGTIYLLAARKSDNTVPSFEAISMRTAIIELLANAFASRWLNRELRAREFEILSRIARTIRLRRVRASADPARLPEFCELILRDAVS